MTDIHSGNTSVSPIEPSLVEHYARILTEAFRDDHLYSSVLPLPETRGSALTWMHRRIIGYCGRFGFIVTLPQEEGIACWLPPGQTDITMRRIIRSGLVAMPVVFGPAAYGRLDAYMRVAGRLRMKNAPVDYWYLWILGVAPESQGKGIGGRLMLPVLEKADTARHACFLETEDEKNTGFYEKHGFKIIAEEAIPSLGITTWSMIRMPS